MVLNSFNKIFRVSVVSAVFAAFFAMSGAYAAPTEVEVGAGGSSEVNGEFPFALTTVKLAAGESVKISIGAKGNFTIDWGDGTTPEAIQSAGSALTDYSHSYATSGVHTIRIGGTAESYNDRISAVSFEDICPNVSSITGSLGAVFGTVGANQPVFKDTFSGCSRIKELPDDLFTGVVGSTKSMFENTFAYCSNLTRIPEGLFSTIKGATSGLFKGTFHDCVRLDSIPEGLFRTIDGGAAQMFESTFMNCTRLTAIPDGLFSGVNEAAENMFVETFSGCRSVTGYIPSKTFAGLIAAGSPMESGMFSGAFARTQLSTDSCPTGLSLFTTGYEEEWGGYISCDDAANTDIKIATVVHTNNQFSPVESRLTALITQVGNIITTTATQAGNIGTLFTGKQDRPDENCPEGWKCLLVKDSNDVEHWYPIIEGESRITEADPTTVFTPKFSFTTTSMAANTTLFVDMSAQGTFTIDWGDGTREDIDRSSLTTTTRYSHTYTTSGAKTVGFDGTATDYNEWASVINFYRSLGVNMDWEAAPIASVSGKLGALFPTLNNGATVPSFNGVFTGCTDLHSVPSDLFQGVTGASSFAYAFSGSGLQSIPSGLFSGISGARERMFEYTFQGTPIQSIPSGLFSNINGIADFMFANTFANTNVTSVPSGLFSGVHGSGAGVVFSHTFFGDTHLTTLPANLFGGQIAGDGSMFMATFSGCTSLQTVPATLFSGVYGSGQYMFYETFKGSGLTHIPGALFSGIDNSTGPNLGGMFAYTFQDCTSLQDLPANLFSGVTRASNSMFDSTFKGCSSLSGYIPASMFSGLIANGSPYSSDSGGMMETMFYGTNLATSCPSGTTRVTTGYEFDWNGKVACEPNS